MRSYLEGEEQLEYLKMNWHYLGVSAIEFFLLADGTVHLVDMLNETGATYTTAQTVGLTALTVGAGFLTLYKGIESVVRSLDGISILAGCSPYLLTEDDYEKFVDRKEKIKQLVRR